MRVSAKVLISTLLIAVFALVAAPALAATYVPSPAGATPVTASPSQVTPGKESVITFAPGTFAPFELVSLTIQGSSANGINLASYVRTADEQTIVKRADAKGGLTLSLRLPVNASGNYVVKGTGETSGDSSSVTIAVAKKTTPRASAKSTGIAAVEPVILSVVAVIVVICIIVAVIVVRRRRRAAR